MGNRRSSNGSGKWKIIKIAIGIFIVFLAFLWISTLINVTGGWADTTGCSGYEGVGPPAPTYGCWGNIVYLNGTGNYNIYQNTQYNWTVVDVLFVFNQSSGQNISISAWDNEATPVIGGLPKGNDYEYPGVGKSVNIKVFSEPPIRGKRYVAYLWARYQINETSPVQYADFGLVVIQPECQTLFCSITGIQN